MENYIMCCLNRFILYTLCLYISNIGISTASFVDYGTYLSDLDSGLNWRDMSYTDGLSYDAVLTQLNGGILNGWRVATAEEVVQLTTNWLGHAAVGGSSGSWSSDNVGLHNLGDDLGFTYYGQNPDFGYVVGNTSTFSSQFSRQLTIQFGYNVNKTGEFYGYDRWGVTAEQADPLIGTFLVQSSDMSPVPIPSAVWLMGSGLLSFLGFSRKRKSQAVAA